MKCQSSPHDSYFISMYHPANTRVAVSDRFALCGGSNTKQLDSPKNLSWWSWQKDQTTARKKSEVSLHKDTLTASTIL